MITVYLDNQDYSTLTDPKQQSLALAATRAKLLDLSRSGAVRFVFSSVAICEAVPLTPESVSLAEMKAALLVDLCGSNVLVSFDRLVSMEIEAMLGRTKNLVQPIDSDGTWFPDLGSPDEEGSIWRHMQDMADADLKQQGLPRQQRRAMARKLVKHGKPRAAFLSHLDQQNSRPMTSALMEKYPMRPEHAELMVRYGLGRASEQEFMEALAGSLRDPRWMMRWFATDHALASPIAEIVRRPGRELGEMTRKLAAASLKYANALTMLDPDGLDPIGRNGQITREWAEFQERQLVSIACRLALSWFGANLPQVTASIVDVSCPGLSTTIRSLYSSVWDNVGGGRKELPSDSQPVDALHALYAPYVDVFRADRFMAPHIQRQVSRHRTIVVPRLSQLVETIEQQLSANAS